MQANRYLLKDLLNALNSINALVPLGNKDGSYVRNYRMIYSALSALLADLTAAEKQVEMLKQDCERISEQLSEATKYYIPTPQTSIVEDPPAPPRGKRKNTGETNA